MERFFISTVGLFLIAVAAGSLILLSQIEVQTRSLNFLRGFLAGFLGFGIGYNILKGFKALGWIGEEID